MSPVRYRDISDYDPGPQHGYACRGPDYDHVSHDCHAHRACHDDDDDGDGDDGPQRCPSRTNHRKVSPVVPSVWHFQMTASSKCHCLNPGATRTQGVVVLDRAQVPRILAQTTLPFASSPMPPAPKRHWKIDFMQTQHVRMSKYPPFVPPEKPLYAQLAMQVAGLFCWYLTKRKNTVTPNVHTTIVTQSTMTSPHKIELKSNEACHSPWNTKRPLNRLHPTSGFQFRQFGSVSFLLPGNFLQVVLRVEQGVHVTNAFHTPGEEN